MVVFIPTVDARDMPGEVEDYCAEREISTHYQNDIVWVEDDGSPLAEWIKSQGVELGEGRNIGIFAT